MKRGILKFLVALVFLAIVAPANAQREAGVRDGWERDSRYNHYFDADSVIYVSGKIVTINREHKPLPGMADGFALTLEAQDGALHLVEVGPSWFTNFYKQKWDVSVGDVVEVRGSKTKVDGEPVIMAVWGRKGDLAMTVRSLYGAPVWDLDLADF